MNKKGNSSGLDGIPMEAIRFGGTKLFIHLCFVFNVSESQLHA